MKTRSYLWMLLALAAGLASCRQEAHDLLGVATAQVQAPPDTVGWGTALRGMHGVWLSRTYAEQLHRNRSIVAADQLAGEQLNILNINTDLLEGDSLPIVSMHTSGGEVARGALFFKLDTAEQRGRIRLLSRHTVMKDLPFTYLNINTIGAIDLLELLHLVEGSVERDVYLRVSRSVSPRVYGYDPSWGVSAHMEALIVGDYQVLSPKGEVLPWTLALKSGGEVGHALWDRYRWMELDGRDALVLQRMPQREEDRSRELRFEIVMPSRDAVELYAWQRKGRRKTLLYRLRRLPAASPP